MRLSAISQSNSNKRQLGTVSYSDRETVWHNDGEKERKRETYFSEVAYTLTELYQINKWSRIFSKKNNDRLSFPNFITTWLKQIKFLELKLFLKIWSPVEEHFSEKIVTLTSSSYPLLSNFAILWTILAFVLMTFSSYICLLYLSSFIFSPHYVFPKSTLFYLILNFWDRYFFSIKNLFHYILCLLLKTITFLFKCFLHHFFYTNFYLTIYLLFNINIIKLAQTHLCLFHQAWLVITLHYVALGSL